MSVYIYIYIIQKLKLCEQLIQLMLLGKGCYARILRCGMMPNLFSDNLHLRTAPPRCAQASLPSAIPHVRKKYPARRFISQDQTWTWGLTPGYNRGFSGTYPQDIGISHCQILLPPNFRSMLQLASDERYPILRPSLWVDVSSIYPMSPGVDPQMAQCGLMLLMSRSRS